MVRILTSTMSNTLLAHAAYLHREVSGAAGDAVRCARFVRGALAHDARSDDVYISSYPRSGTTWLQLIVHLVQGGDQDFAHISHVVPWYERSLALGQCTARDFAARSSPRAFKSHLPYQWLPKGGRYVYVHRDGRDVLVSYYHLYRSHLGFAGTFDQFFTRFMAGDVQYRSWFRHVREWQAQASRPNVLILAYEDLRRDPLTAVQRVARLCNVWLDEARAREIVGLSSFEAMKRSEDKFDHATAERLPRDARRGEFVRRGLVGSYREVLSEEQQRRFERELRRHRSWSWPETALSAFLH
jgi:hypothetical protein